ncbi:Cadherin [Penicillium nucicola]|uniref:Cadherin n=1 Tax=Penicillium nucicola TaxID=1850975 RepID=UPI002544F01D|nr:Cadherin [Penicillium nucicola]KAJ5747489.1 Cadherin [Penicillium nucicola]
MTLAPSISQPWNGSMSFSLLQETVAILREAAELLKRSEAAPREHWYTHLWAQCILIRELLCRIESFVEEHNQHVVDLLTYLEIRIKGLIIPPGKASDQSPARRYARLLKISKLWQEIKTHDTEAKLAFIHAFFDLQPHAEFLEYLEQWYNIITVKYPESPSNLSHNRPESRRRKRKNPSDDVWDAAQSLFNALLESKDCECRPVHDFGMRLHVGTYRKPPGITMDACSKRDFEMFISMEEEWHEAHVWIDEKQRDKIVQFVTETEITEPKRQKHSRQMKVTQLCPPIRKSRPSDRRLELKVDGQGRLLKLISKKCCFAVDTPPVSLEEFMQSRSRSFTDKTKRILAVLLSYALLHLHGTAWLSPSWGPSNVYFFRTNTARIPLKPFIQASLDARPDVSSSLAGGPGEFSTDEEDLEDIDPDDVLVHQCPALVSLGVMLMEMFLATPFETLAQQSGVYPADRMKFTDADTVFQNFKAEIPQNSQFYYAVEKCLDPSVWENEDAIRLDDDTIRKLIYEEVVQPLEDELFQGFSYISRDDLDQFAQNLDFDGWGQVIQSQHKESSNSQPESIQRSDSYPNADKNSLEFFDDDSIADSHTTEACQNYKIWEVKYMEVYEKFIQSPPKSPVKIAILDTGIDEKHPDIDACVDQIKDRYDWTDESSNGKANDRTGHGTFIAALLLKYAPDAEIYIAKICDTRPSSPQTIAKAINYAVNEWKVDIITMSFGFPTRNIVGYNELENAIDRAHFENVLLLAAASNNGGNNDRAYPAGEEKVICIHSTDSNGNRSPFSPTARADAINIGTIGEAVTSAWPVHLCSPVTALPVKQKSGTSFATAIAAGITAFLIQYVRLYLPEHAQKVKRKAKMEAVFRRIAEKTASSIPRDDYHYFSLSQHPSNLFGKQRHFIDETLRDILDHA